MTYNSTKISSKNHFTKESDKKVEQTNMRVALSSKNSKSLYYYARFMILVGMLGQSLYYLQAFKILRQGSAADVSLEGFIVALFALICWMIYGFLVKDKVIIIVNVFGSLGAGLTLISILLNL
jgi:MtN3 and saliva related transmembrane protein